MMFEMTAISGGVSRRRPSLSVLTPYFFSISAAGLNSSSPNCRVNAMCCSSLIGCSRKRSTRLASQEARIASRSSRRSGWQMSTPRMSAPSPAANGTTSMLIASLRGRQGFDAVIVDRNPPMDAVLLRRIVAGRLVIGTPVIPDDDVALAPFVPVFGPGLDHVALELGDQRIALAAVGAD